MPGYFEVGSAIPVKSVQLAILTGMPMDELKAGHEFRWGKGMLKLESIGPEDANIKRLAFDQTNTMNPSQFHELDAWSDATPELENPLKNMKPNRFTDPANTDNAGRDTMPKNEIFPHELKSPRPGPKEDGGYDKRRD